jgi:hypothetical protein
MAWSDAARAAALEARRRHARQQRLFHGTNSEVTIVKPLSHWWRKNSSGRGSYLTGDASVARGFAKMTAEERGGHPVVFMIRASDRKAYGLRRISDEKKDPIYIATKPLTGAKRLTVKKGK